MRSLSLVSDLRSLFHTDQIPRSPKSCKSLVFGAKVAAALKTERHSHSAAQCGKLVRSGEFAGFE